MCPDKQTLRNYIKGVKQGSIGQVSGKPSTDMRAVINLHKQSRVKDTLELKVPVRV